MPDVPNRLRSSFRTFSIGTPCSSKTFLSEAQLMLTCWPQNVHSSTSTHCHGSLCSSPESKQNQCWKSVWELLSENTHIGQQNATLVLSAKRPSHSVPHMKHQKPGLADSVGLKRHACKIDKVTSLPHVPYYCWIRPDMPVLCSSHMSQSITSASVSTPPWRNKRGAAALKAAANDSRPSPTSSRCATTQHTTGAETVWCRGAKEGTCTFRRTMEWYSRSAISEAARSWPSCCSRV